MKGATARLISLTGTVCAVIAFGQLSSAAGATAESKLQASAGVADCDVLYPDAVTRFVESGADATRATGARNRPFASLADAEAASAPGDAIMVIHVPAQRDALDGGITLKDCQKLLGTGPPVTTASANAARAKITNSVGAAVTLADHNEVAGLHIENAGGYAIVGTNTTGGSIHDNLITGWNQLELFEEFQRFAYRRGSPAAVTFLADTGAVTENEVRANVLRDANSGGIGVLAAGNADATVRVDGNLIENLDGSSFLPRGGGRNHGIGAGAFDGATVNLTITNTAVDNVGHKSDGIVAVACASGLPRRWAWLCGDDPGPGGSVNLVVREFVYLNTRGYPTTNGIETITAPGARMTVLMENSDIISARGAGVVIYNPAGNPESDVIDLGGGPLGSVGQNRIVDSGLDFGLANTPLISLNGDLVAKQNWWGFPDGLEVDSICSYPPAPTPAEVAMAFVCFDSSLDFTAFLTEDPRP